MEEKVKHSFLCIGFAKCGTTTLHEVFKNHKDIYLPAIKETYLYFPKGYDWYLKRYYDKKIDKKFVGEFNPTYTMAVNTHTTDEIAKRIYDDFGKDIKIIMMLRNPVNKLYSWYKYGLSYGWIYEKPKDNIVPNISEGFKEHVKNRFLYDQNLENVTLNLGKNPRTHYELEGEYSKFIDSFLKYFPKENIKFIIFEEFAKNQEKTCKEILEFIGAEEDNNVDYMIRANEGNRAPKSSFSIVCMKAWKKLRHYYYKYIPFISYEFSAGVMNMGEKIEKALTKPLEDKSKMDDDTRKILENFYRKDKEAVEKVTGKDLSEIWFN